MSHSHSHEGAGAGHSHDPVQAALDHGHTHEILDGPGSYMGREMPIIEGRNWEERAYTVGIGGYVSLSVFGGLGWATHRGDKHCVAQLGSFPTKLS